jgi:MFS family permease
MGKGGLLFGISVFWLALSLVFDGLKTLVLPARLLGMADEAHKATVLGLVVFVGLLAGALVQPVAGTVSDRLYSRWGRRGTVALGALLLLASLGLFGLARGPLTVLAAYVLVQVAASTAQAAQQGFIPDLVPVRWRGTAAGLKGFMDVGGALLAFVMLGALLEGGGIWPTLAATAAVVVAALVLTLALVREPGGAGAPGATAAAPGRKGPRGALGAFRLDLRRHRVFAWLVVSRFLFLFGTYAVGQFFLFFVADRLGLEAGQAAEEAGGVLAGLALITVLAAPPAGWAADRWGRPPMMVAGAVLSAVGVLLLTGAASAGHILASGGLMAVGSAAFAGANWAQTADVAPPAAAGRFLALANFGTAGAAAAAGLLGPLVDGANRLAPGAGYTALFAVAALAFAASALALWPVAGPETFREAGLELR